MQSAGAEGENRCSPSTMEKPDGSAKKARLEELLNGHVKQEVGVHHAAGGGDDGGSIVAAEVGCGSRVELAVKIDMSVLHCPLCTRPFKPPVFQCKGRHLGCGGCVALLPGGQCRACEDGGGFFAPCPVLDAVVSSTKVACPHAGCQRNRRPGVHPTRAVWSYPSCS